MLVLGSLGNCYLDVWRVHRECLDDMIGLFLRLGDGYLLVYQVSLLCHVVLPVRHVVLLARFVVSVLEVDFAIFYRLP